MRYLWERTSAGSRRVGPSDQRTAAGFVGAGLSCVRPAREVGSSDQGTEPILGQVGAGSARTILSFGACWSPGGHKKGPPLRNSMRLVYPMAFFGLSFLFY